MTYMYFPIPSERCVKYKIFVKNLFYLNSTARATQNRIACHFGHACHRFAMCSTVMLQCTVSKGMACASNNRTYALGFNNLYGDISHKNEVNNQVKNLDFSHERSQDNAI